jgi:translation elongation factor EF-1beta
MGFEFDIARIILHATKSDQSRFLGKILSDWNIGVDKMRTAIDEALANGSSNVLKLLQTCYDIQFGGIDLLHAIDSGDTKGHCDNLELIFKSLPGVDAIETNSLLLISACSGNVNIFETILRLKNVSETNLDQLLPSLCRYVTKDYRLEMLQHVLSIARRRNVIHLCNPNRLMRLSVKYRKEQKIVKMTGGRKVKYGSKIINWLKTEFPLTTTVATQQK